MCKAMEDMRKEAAEQAVEQEKISRVKNLLKLGKLSFEEIANVMELSVEKVKELAMPEAV